MAGMNRRQILAGSVAAGASLLLGSRASGQSAEPDLSAAFDRAFAKVPAKPSDLTAYQKRIVEVAKRERERSAKYLWRRDIVGVADFALPSSRPRLHFVNLEDGTVRSYLVAHGKGSDWEHDGWLKRFSNVPGSWATSRGAYLTCEWYEGKYGTSIRLAGLDADNSMAMPRAIVMHSAEYAKPEMVEKHGKLGRSEGCFAMSPTDFNDTLTYISGGRLLFADRIGEV